MSQTYFATIAPGLEESLQQEIRALGGRKPKIITGGVEFESTWAKIHKILADLRCANRLVVRVDEFRARDREELFRKTNRIEWEKWLAPGTPIMVSPSANKSRIIHTGVITEVVTEAITKRLGSDESITPQRLMVRMNADRCALSLDLSGELLYRRGWREEVSAAPIRESVAAALLRVAKWEPGTPLLDPVCGSGTFVIEAAQRELGIPVARTRRFAFQNWKTFDTSLWPTLQATSTEENPTALPLLGVDIEPDIVEIAKRNAKRAGVADYCRFEVGSALDISPPDKPGLLIANPPYGLRMGTAAVADGLVQRLETEFQGWRAALIMPRSWKAPKNGQVLAKFKNGGVEVNFWGWGFD